MSTSDKEKFSKRILNRTYLDEGNGCWLWKGGVWNKKALELHGEFARLNIIPDEMYSTNINI